MKQFNQKSNRCESDIALSKALSWVLRHSAPTLGLKLSIDGYVPVQALLSCGHARFKYCNEEDIKRVVQENEKQRFRLCTRKVIVTFDPTTARNRYTIENEENDETSSTGQDMLCIRANQGHTISSDISPEYIVTPISADQLENMDTVVHGTTFETWHCYIRHEGLSRMKRNHIHFATGLPKDAVQVVSGMRKSSEVYIYVDTKKCATDGVKFFRSDNGVILTPGATSDGFLPLCYFKKVVLANTNEILMSDSTVEIKMASAEHK